MNFILGAKNSGETMPFIIVGIILAIVFILLLIVFVDNTRRKILRKKVLNSPEAVVRNAYFVKSKYVGGSSTVVGSTIVKARSDFDVYVRYRDDNGFEKTGKAIQKFTTEEMNNLRARRYLTVKILGKHIVILDDATVPVPADAVNNVDPTTYGFSPVMTDETTDSDLHPFAGTRASKLKMVAGILLALIGIGGAIAMLILGFVNWDKALTYFGVIIPFVLMIVVGIIVAKSSMRDVNTMKNGTPGKAKLLFLDTERRYDSDGDSHLYMNAFILFDGERMKIKIESEEIYMYLQNHFIDKDIPVRYLNDNVVIDYSRLYSNSTF